MVVPGCVGSNLSLLSLILKIPVIGFKAHWGLKLEDISWRHNSTLDILHWWKLQLDGITQGWSLSCEKVWDEMQYFRSRGANINRIRQMARNAS